MAEFDADAARAAGHSEDEIARVQRGIAAARAAGYSDDEIAKHLGGAPAAAAPPAAGTPIPTETTPSAPPAAPETTPEWFARNFTHLPLVGAQAVLNAGTGIPFFAAVATTLRQPFWQRLISPRK